MLKAPRIFYTLQQKKEIKETERERLYAVNCGKRIRKLREQKGLTQEELAEIVHCSAVSLGRIERGQQNIKLWHPFAEILLAQSVPCEP